MSTLVAAGRRELGEALLKAAPGAVSFGVPLDVLSRWKIGGRAWVLVEPGSSTDAAAIMKIMRDRDEAFVVIGETSNILFDSSGFDGVLMRIGPRMARFSLYGNTVEAQAGVSVPKLARAVAQAGLGGIEHVAGIPGSLGGLVVMNGGSQRKGIGSHVRKALCVDEVGRLVTLDKDDLKFAYRTSSIQGRRRFAVLEVVLDLDKGSAVENVASIDAILHERQQKFPLDLPNCGSTFLSDPATYPLIGPPGRAIEEAGLKGVRRGDAQISSKHANFIVNLGRSTDSDVLWLIALIRSTVFDRTGMLMNCEVRHLSADGVFRPAHEAAEERWPNVEPYGK